MSGRAGAKASGQGRADSFAPPLVPTGIVCREPPAGRTRAVPVGSTSSEPRSAPLPGGLVSGAALLRPDLPELKEFPYLWQQNEYVMGGGASNFMFLALAAKAVLQE